MATHLCPSCHKTGFTWSVDEEVSTKCRWRCSECGYEAEEDEKKPSSANCPKCGAENIPNLENASGNYPYCLACGFKKPTIKG